jgi:vitamin B12 transporter
MVDALPPTLVGTEVVVIGDALAVPASERPYHVDKIGQSELRDAPARELDEILKRVPGLQLFRRSDSTSGHPTSQGVTLRALGGNASSRALLLLDGVPQADPFGGWVNWPAYDAGGLKEVRILRGGGSVPHGSGALAGVIEMESLTNDGLAGSIEGGSRNSLRGRLYVGEPVGEGLMTLNAQAGRSDGFIPVTRSTRGAVDKAAPYEEASVRARLIAPVGKDAELQVSGLAFADRRDRGVDFTGNRTRGADASVRLVNRGRWQWSATAYTQWRNLRSSFASVSDDRSMASRVSLQDSVPSRSVGFGSEVRPPSAQGLDLRFGADTRLTSGESRELFAYVAGDPSRRRIAGGETRTLGLFGEVTLTRGPLTLSGGARADHWKIADGHLAESLLADGTSLRDDTYASRSGWLPTVRAGAVLALSDGLDVRLAAYRGWRMPTLNELFRSFRAGPDATAANALLDPETLAGAEAGINFRGKTVGLSITAFTNRLNDAIANVTLGRGPGNFPGVGFVAGAYRQRQNINAVRVHGIEAAGEMQKGPWSIWLGGSLTNAEVETSPGPFSLDGLRPAQTPKVAVSGGVTWEARGRTIALQFRHVGAQFEDDQNDRRLRSATTIDAFGALPLRGRFDVVVRGQNLLNETVEAGIGDDGSVERASPRTLWFGVRLRTD